MTAPIESCGNNKAVRRVGNCITCRQLHHGKSTLEAAAMQWLLQHCDSEAALETAWWCSGFGNSLAVDLATTWRWLWQQDGGAALLIAWWWCSLANSVAVQRYGNSVAGSGFGNSCHA